MKYALLAMVLLLGCRVGQVDGAPTVARVETSIPVAPPGGARCDPSRCDAFCTRMSCVVGAASACLEMCEQRCGDAYFELADESMMECVLEGEVGGDCSKQQACCSEHFTTELCKE